MMRVEAMSWTLNRLHSPLGDGVDEILCLVCLVPLPPVLNSPYCFNIAPIWLEGPEYNVVNITLI